MEEKMSNLASKEMSFQNENSWLVQFLSLATIALLAYMHIAPVANAAG